MEGFDVILPRNSSPSKIKSLQKLNIYYDDRAPESIIESEYLLWFQKWQHIEEKETQKSYGHFGQPRQNVSS